MLDNMFYNYNIPICRICANVCIYAQHCTIGNYDIDFLEKFQIEDQIPKIDENLNSITFLKEAFSIPKTFTGFKGVQKLLKS
jgi:hypothetical protein